MTLDGLLAYLRLEVERAGGVRPLSRRWSLDAGHISRVLRKEKRPGPIVLARLGLRERIEYEADVRGKTPAGTPESRCGCSDFIKPAEAAR